MFDLNNLETGAVPLLFPEPEEFRWVRPLLYGCVRQGPGEWAVSGQRAGAVLCVIEGGGEVLSGPDRVPCAAGCVVAAPDAARLRLRAARPTLCLYLLAEGADTLLAELPPVLPDPRSDLAQRLAGLYLRARQGEPGDLYGASAELYGLLMALRRLCGGAPGAYSALVRDAVALIGREYAFLEGVEALAAALGVTASHLVRRFTAEVGVGPGRYLQQVRLEHARLLLLGRDHSIEVVAGLVGFSGAGYFCKVFRARFGLSPGRYREAHRGATLDLTARRRLQELEYPAQV